MSGDARNERDKDGLRNSDQPTDEAALSARLNSLDKRLSKLGTSREAHGTGPGRANDDGGSASIGQGIRLSTELVAGVLVGSAIGWGIDRLLSTRPWGLLLFLLLGFAAGIMNMMRATSPAKDAGAEDTRKD
jgi:ATP synthase protein I